MIIEAILASGCSLQILAYLGLITFAVVLPCTFSVLYSNASELPRILEYLHHIAIGI